MCIAGRLGRTASTISRELARNGGRLGYRAHRADRVAWRRARRPQSSKTGVECDVATKWWRTIRRLVSSAMPPQAKTPTYHLLVAYSPV